MTTDIAKSLREETEKLRRRTEGLEKRRKAGGPPTRLKIPEFYVIGGKGWGVTLDYETFLSPTGEKLSLAEVQTRFPEIGDFPLVYDYTRDMFVPSIEEEVERRRAEQLALFEF